MVAASEDAAEIERIARFLTREGPGFGLALVLHADRVLADQVRERLVARMAAQGRRISTIELSYADERLDLVQRMVEASADADALFVVGLDRLATDAVGRPRQTPALANLNQARDKLPSLLDVRVVVWAARSAYPALTDAAADFLQVMLSVINLEATRDTREIAAAPLRVDAPPAWLRLAEDDDKPELERQLERLGKLSDTASNARARADAAASAGELALRLGQLARARSWAELASSSYAEAEQPREAATQARRLAEIELYSGELDEAGTHAELALRLAREADDAREQALARALLAELTGRRCVTMGELEEAIFTLEHEILPALERLGDRESQAAILSRIADLLELRGDLDEALRVRRDRVAPLLDQAPPTEEVERSRHANVAKITDILASKGELDEALQLEVASLPPSAPQPSSVLTSLAAVQEARGDVDAAKQLRRKASRSRAADPHSRAETLADEADELQALGRFEEALALRREQELPAYEQLGDERARILTLGKVADLLVKLGRIAEARALLTEQMLPAARQLGDSRLVAAALSRVVELPEDEVFPLGAPAEAPTSSSDRPRSGRALLWVAVAVASAVAVFVSVRAWTRPRPETIRACQIVVREQASVERVMLAVGEDYELGSDTIAECRAGASARRVVYTPESGDLQVLTWDPAPGPRRERGELDCARLWTACSGMYECLVKGQVGCAECVCTEAE